MGFFFYEPPKVGDRYVIVDPAQMGMEEAEPGQALVLTHKVRSGSWGGSWGVTVEETEMHYVLSESWIRKGLVKKE